MAAEWLKIRKSVLIIISIITPICINGLLAFDLHYRYFGYLVPHQSETGLSNWQLIFKEQTIFYFSELLPLFGALFLYELFAMEVKNNGWMLITTMPVKKSKTVLIKLFYSFLFMTVLLLFNIITIIIAGLITGVEGPSEIALFARVFFIQWISMIGALPIILLIMLVLEKIIYIIPVALLAGFVSGQLYYADSESILSRINPFTMASSCFRGNSSTIILTIIESTILCLFFSFLITYVIRKKELLR